MTGSAFSTVDALSRITVNGGCFFPNPAGCTQAAMVNVTTGQPFCNPFIPPGFPQNLSPATVTFNGVKNNCDTANNSVSRVSFFPNPFSSQTIFRAEYPLVKATLSIFNPNGQILKEVKNISGQTITLY